MIGYLLSPTGGLLELFSHPFIRSAFLAGTGVAARLRPGRLLLRCAAQPGVHRR